MNVILVNANPLNAVSAQDILFSVFLTISISISTVFVYFYWHLKRWRQKLYKKMEIYYIGYITIKEIGDYKNINSVIPFYLMI